MADRLMTLAYLLAYLRPNIPGTVDRSPPQRGADLGFCWSRLSESNRRPSHYEICPAGPSTCVGVRRRRSAGCSLPQGSVVVRQNPRRWLTEWLNA